MHLLEWTRTDNSIIVLNLANVTDVISTNTGIKFYTVNSLDPCVTLLIKDIEVITDINDRVKVYSKILRQVMRFCHKNGHVVIDTQTGLYHSVN